MIRRFAVHMFLNLPVSGEQPVRHGILSGFLKRRLPGMAVLKRVDRVADEPGFHSGRTLPVQGIQLSSWQVTKQPRLIRAKDQSRYVADESGGELRTAIALCRLLQRLGDFG